MTSKSKPSTSHSCHLAFHGRHLSYGQRATSTSTTIDAPKTLIVSCWSSFPVPGCLLPCRSRRYPHREQVLARVVGGACLGTLPVVVDERGGVSLSFLSVSLSPLLVRTSHSTPFHPMSNGSWQWLGVLSWGSRPPLLPRPPSPSSPCHSSSPPLHRCGWYCPPSPILHLPRTPAHSIHHASSCSQRRWGVLVGVWGRSSSSV
jgi:hypothetical protein